MYIYIYIYMYIYIYIYNAVTALSSHCRTIWPRCTPALCLHHAINSEASNPREEQIRNS